MKKLYIIIALLFLFAIPNRTFSINFNSFFQPESPEVITKTKENIKKKATPIKIAPKKKITKKKIPLKETSPLLDTKKIIPYVVKVECESSQGSGTIIKTRNGGVLVLTNNHVTIGEDYCIVITSNKEKYLVEVDSYASIEDFSILKFVDKVNFATPLESCIPKEIKIGKEITIFGFPGTENVVITKGKILSRVEGDEGDFGQWIATSAKIDFGNSGGGAFLNNGCFAGIPTAMFTTTKQSIIHYIGWR